MISLAAPFEVTETQRQAINSLIAGLNKKYLKQTLLGVTGCGKTFTIANVIASTGRPTLIIAHNKTLAAQLYEEMKGYFPSNAVEYFVSYYDYYQPEAYLPTSDTYIEKDASINEHIEQMRLSATRSLFERRDTIIIASVSAIYGLGDPEVYGGMSMFLSCGDKIDQKTIISKLADLQFQRNDFELRRGTYRVRGETIDIFPAESAEQAVRIALFDEVVDSISYFDPLTGKAIRQVLNVKIFPKTHYVTQREIILEAADQIKIELKGRLDFLYQHNKLLEAQRLKERTEYDLEMLLELGYCTGIENYSRYLSRRNAGEPPPTLIDYLPSDALIVIDESHVTLPQLHGMYNGDRSRKNTLVEYGFRLPSALDNRPLKFAEFEEIAGQTIYVSATPGEYELSSSQQMVELLIRPTGLVDPEVEVRPAKNQVDDLFSEIADRTKAKERVLVTTLTKKMAEELSKYLAENGVKVRYLHSEINSIERVEILRDLRLGVFDVLVGINLLREGLDLPEVSLVAILDADKEGFLRSVSSLIQTSGRASRNLHGKVIMYADSVTKSMKLALAEMERRRKIQREYNLQHEITPKSIVRKIRDVISYNKFDHQKTNKSKVSEITANDLNDPKKMAKRISALEREMYRLARDLEFEKAAQVRDQLQAIERFLDH